MHSGNRTLGYTCGPKQIAPPLITAAIVLTFHIPLIKALVTRRRLELARHKLVTSLSVSDCLSATIMSAVYLGSSQLSLPADRKACLALRRCGQFNFVSTTVVTSLTITALSFERYVACLHSFQLDTIFSSKRVSYGLFIIWGLGGVLGVATALFSPVSQTIKLGDGNSMVQTIIPLFVFPSSLIIILVQLRLYLLSRTKSTDVAPVPDGTNNAEVAEFRKRQIRIAIVAGLTALLYLLCFIPVSFFILLQTQGVDSDTGKFQMIVFWLRMVNGIIDPLLYGIGIKDTRKAVMKELRSFKVAVLERLQSSNV